MQQDGFAAESKRSENKVAVTCSRYVEEGEPDVGSSAG
jgi:hypothetical protein